MVRADRRRRGNAIIEFTLVGIPLIFALISIFEISRGMWIYHTLAYSVTEGTRYASVHGQGCVSAGNSCAAKISDIAKTIQYTGVGLLPNQLSLTFTSNAGTISCTLTNCLTNATVWPPSTSSANLPGMDIAVSASYPFSSAIAMLWPGAGPGIVFPTFNLPATSRERIQF